LFAGPRRIVAVTVPSHRLGEPESLFGRPAYREVVLDFVDAVDPPQRFLGHLLLVIGLDRAPDLHAAAAVFKLQVASSKMRVGVNGQTNLVHQVGDTTIQGGASQENPGDNQQ
jgi:hypothetical protein